MPEQVASVIDILNKLAEARGPEFADGLIKGIDIGIGAREAISGKPPTDVPNAG